MKPSERISEEFHRIKATAVEDARAMIETEGAAFTPEAEAMALQSALSFAIRRYLDEEAERRAKFEADVSERLVKLEALAKPLRYVIAPENMSQAGLAKLIESVKNLGATVLPHGVKVSGPTVEVLEPPFAGWCDRGGVLEKESPAGVYVGDGLPNVRRYEPEANEPE